LGVSHFLQNFSYILTVSLNILASISWRKEVNFQWDDGDVLDQHALLGFYIASSLKLQSPDWHVAPLTHYPVYCIYSGAHHHFLKWFLYRCSILERYGVHVGLYLAYVHMHSTFRSGDIEHFLYMMLNKYLIRHCYTSGNNRYIKKIWFHFFIIRYYILFRKSLLWINCKKNTRTSNNTINFFWTRCNIE
jgi:hypothetical protein